MVFVTECPVCKGSSFVEYLSCNDHTVSHETFQLVQCAGCLLLITSPRPDATELGRYYQSDNYISHSTQARSIIDYVYKITRQFNLRWKINLVKNYCAPESTTLLD